MFASLFGGNGNELPNVDGSKGHLNSLRIKQPSLTIAIVGDKGVGKSALINALLALTFTSTPDTQPVFGEYSCICNSQAIQLHLLEYSNIRLDKSAFTKHEQQVQRMGGNLSKVAFPCTRYIVCFAQNDRTSFHHVKDWVQIIMAANPNAKIMLLATKNDLTASIANREVIALDQSMRTQYSPGSFMYDPLGVSAKNRQAVKTMFHGLVEELSSTPSHTTTRAPTISSSSTSTSETSSLVSYAAVAGGGTSIQGNDEDESQVGCLSSVFSCFGCK